MTNIDTILKIQNLRIIPASSKREHLQRTMDGIASMIAFIDKYSPDHPSLGYCSTLGCFVDTKLTNDSEIQVILDEQNMFAFITYAIIDSTLIAKEYYKTEFGCDHKWIESLGLTPEQKQKLEPYCVDNHSRKTKHV